MITKLKNNTERLASMAAIQNVRMHGIVYKGGSKECAEHKPTGCQECQYQNGCTKVRKITELWMDDPDMPYGEFRKRADVILQE